jgi:fructose/tagatose bisphosphate aldolase
MDADTIMQHISALQRDPFREVLARLLHCEPSIEALQSFADAHPDKWAQSIAVMARGSGFHDNTPTHETNIYMQINNMSDVMLEKELGETMRQLEGAVIVTQPQQEQVEDDSKEADTTQAEPVNQE